MNKKSIFVIIACFCMILSLFSCADTAPTDTPIDTSAHTGGTSDPGNTPTPGLPIYDYSRSIPEYMEYTHSICGSAVTPRGLFYRGNELMCYSPLTGTVASACGDPLCTHDFFSDCTFSDWLKWLEFPVSDGENLYFIHRPFDKKANKTSSVYQIVKCDPSGFNKQVLYETENQIEHILITENALYFSELGSDEGALLYRCDPETGKCASPKVNSDQGLLHTAFLPLQNSVYYVYDGSLFKCSEALTDPEKVMDDYAYTELYTDGEALYHVGLSAGIYKTDLTACTDELIYTVPDGLTIHNPVLSDIGIAFMLRDADSEAFQTDYEEWIASFPENTLYVMPFTGDAPISIALKDFYMYGFDYTLYQNKLYTKEYINSMGQGTAGDWFVIDLSDVDPIRITFGTQE